MIEAVLFDLDGTLLDVDMDDFLKRYIQSFATHLAHFTDPFAFSKNLWASTGAMVTNNDPTMSNEEAFQQHFYTWVQHPHTEVWPYIVEFYESIFPTLQGNAKPYPHVETVIHELRQQKYQLVLATNPIFPLAAISHRLSWSGVNAKDFTLITSYENMHHTKPNPKYYLEISDMLAIAPQSCLMIGNDPAFDIKPAAHVGMKTFLVDETLPGLNVQAACGRVADIPHFIRTLTGNKS